MGLLDRFRRSLASTAPNGAPVHYRHFSEATPYPEVLGMSVESLWKTQPYLRTVVTFLARNIAQLGLHTFQRVSDTDRQRVHDDPLAKLISAPNRQMTSYELVYSLVADLALYDEAFWWIGKDSETPSGWAVQPIPPSWVTERGGGTVFTPGWYDIIPPEGRKAERVPADEFLVFRGWCPDDLTRGSSPVSALKQILGEQIQAQRYRQQVWERGGRHATVLRRPLEAPEWSPEARGRFKADWRSRWTGDGPEAGGTPILEDGMFAERLGFSAHEEEWVEAAKLSLGMVASAYHVNPTMVGLLDNANYSNVREFRRMLYGDTLGPTMAMIEARLNAFLVPRISTTGDLYVEFNINEKLQGSFEEQQQALQSAVGRPYMTADEARSLQNMRALGGDAGSLVTPLNVLVGGQASPSDSGTQNLRSRRSGVKARAPQPHETKAAQVLKAFFTRQSKAVRSRLGARADDWWDAQRWDRELGDDLYAVSVLVSAKVATDVLESIGFSPEAYDTDRTLAFLAAVAQRIAGSVNKVTKSQLDDALQTDDPLAAVEQVFETAQTSRADQIATTTNTTVSGFASSEAAKQVAGDEATKTWHVTSNNPRASHLAMDGETVGIDEQFSNGAMWPADASLDVDETAGCQCALSVNIP